VEEVFDGVEGRITMLSREAVHRLRIEAEEAVAFAVLALAGLEVPLAEDGTFRVAVGADVATEGGHSLIRWIRLFAYSLIRGSLFAAGVLLFVRWLRANLSLWVRSPSLAAS
jgi:hypothetical protein